MHFPVLVFHKKDLKGLEREEYVRKIVYKYSEEFEHKCECCGGVGDVENSIAFYDWYTIGGRWENFHHKYKNKKVKNLEIRTEIFGFIDLDGQYHENDVYWDILDNIIIYNHNKYYKNTELDNYIINNGDCYITVVDFHV